MKAEDIKHPELKQLINMSYLHGENNNQKMIEKTDDEIKEYLSENIFIISGNQDELFTIPYGNDGEYVIPIFTDVCEYNEGSEKLSKLFLDEISQKIISPEDIKKLADDDENFKGIVINPHSQNFRMNPEGEI